MIELVMVTVLFTVAPAPVEAPCAPDLIHYMPYCLTPAEYQAIINPPPPAPLYVAVGGVEQWRAMVDYFWGKHGATNLMLNIMDCESGGDPNAKNPNSSASGLFQIMRFWQSDWPGDYFDPWTNAAVAYQIWLEADRWGSPYSPWYASRSCWG